jgi:hypothetical protein
VALRKVEAAVRLIDNETLFAEGIGGEPDVIEHPPNSVDTPMDGPEPDA